MVNWEAISINREQRRREGQPRGQEGEVNWKVEKLEKLKKEVNKDTTRPMLTIKQARDTFMSRAIEGVRASIISRKNPFVPRERAWQSGLALKAQ